ncbi:hypothetical protein [Serinibacter arcticus]|uniref:Uncharacterized protein n=1 Tax=Serinibacter arcticus TaxID=1655435 RepID=A0A4Z1E0Z7_9MICO|nr:hypothetical protein [Serinibacter arcticus]TGO05584.1 hypothetical protein SERN_1588 [Serinibacter arcticus]
MTQRPTDEFSDPSAEDDGDVRPRRGTDPSAAGPPAWDGEPADVESDDDPTPPPPPGRRRRRTFLAGAAGLVVLTLGTGALLHAQERERRTPEAAVLEYVQLVEAGDVEAATDLVPVPGTSTPADATGPTSDAASPGGDRPVTVEVPSPPELLVTPELLTDAFYATHPGLTDASVELVDPDADPAVGDVVEVRVSYEVQERPATTALRVERLADTFPALPSYRVVDSLALPAVVDVLDFRLGQARIADVPVAASSSVGSGETQVATMLYPGEYPVAFDGGAHLESDEVTMRVAGPTGARGADARPVSRAFLQVQPSFAALERAQQEANAFLTACADGSAPRIAECPESFLVVTDGGEPPSFTDAFTAVDLSIYATQSAAGRAPLVQASLEKTVVVTDPDGTREEPVRLVVNLQPDDGEAPADVYAGIVLG